MSRQPELTGMSDFLHYWGKNRRLGDIPQEFRDRLSNHYPASELRDDRIPTIEMIARMAGVGDRQYRRFTKHGGRGHGREFVADLVQVLGCTPEQTRAIYEWSQHAPPRTAITSHEIDEDMRRHLHEIPHAALYVDAHYNVLAYNEYAAIHWRWVSAPEANVVKWVLGPEPARAMLLDWEESWGRPAVEIVRQGVLHPLLKERWQAIRDEVRAHPATEALWHGGDLREAIDGTRPILRGDLIWRVCGSR